MLTDTLLSTHVDTVCMGMLLCNSGDIHAGLQFQVASSLHIISVPTSHTVLQISPLINILYGQKDLLRIKFSELLKLESFVGFSSDLNLNEK